MMSHRGEGWSRREFLGGVTLGGTAALVAVATNTYFAPQLMADELLQAGEFSDVRYVKTAADASKVLVG